MKAAILTTLATVFVLLQFSERASAQALPIVNGEILLVQFKGVPQAEAATHNGTYTVDDQGYIEMPYIKSRIRASGKTTSQLEKVIANLYKTARIYPQVTITIQKNADAVQANITIGGRRAGNPGQFPYSRDMKLADAVALARPSQFFRGVVHIIRGKQTFTYNYNDEKSKAVRLYPKDIVELVK